MERYKKRSVHFQDVDSSPLEAIADDPSPNDDPGSPEPDLDIPSDDILDMLQGHTTSDEQLDHIISAHSMFQDYSPRNINTFTHYHVSNTSRITSGSLVDRGANGGLAGADVRVLGRSNRKCNITGIDNHEVSGLDVVQCVALVKTDIGLINLIMNEYAYYGKGNSIHASGQIEHFKHTVHDKSVLVGGKQCIHLLDGYAIPLVCKGGLIYLQFAGKPTDKELDQYPSVHLTSPHEWEPSLLDYEHPQDDGEPPWADGLPPTIANPPFDEFGNYNRRVIANLMVLADYPDKVITLCKHVVSKSTPDFEKLRPYFGWANISVIEKTFA